MSAVTVQDAERDAPTIPPPHSLRLSLHYRDAKVYGHTTTAMYDMGTPPSSLHLVMV